jgi:hypothetical protein
VAVEVIQAEVGDPRLKIMATVTNGASQEVSEAALTDSTGALITAANPLPTSSKSADYSTEGNDPRRVDLAVAGTPVECSAENADWLHREITNPGDHDVWVGHTDTVATSGATTGILVEALNANGSYIVPASYRGSVYFDANDPAAYVVVQEVGG